MTARNLSWRGDAVAVAQVNTATIGGTILVTDTVSITINNKTLTVVTGSTIAATVAATVVAAWNALNATLAPEFGEITAAQVGWTAAFTLTADTPGRPFTIAAATATNSTTITAAPFTATVANAGPNDASTIANYQDTTTPLSPADRLPATGDTLTIDNTASSLLYGLSALSGVTLAGLTITGTFAGTIGLPNVNAGGYYEYRPKTLAVGATVCDIGIGAGNGSGRIKINFGSVQTATTVWNAGSPAENNIPAVLLAGTHASNTLAVLKGAVGSAFFAGDVSTWASVKLGYVSSPAGDANVLLGSGATLTAIVQGGGNLNLQSAFTTLTQESGIVTIGGAATGTTLTIGGTLIDQSSGIFTTVNLDGIYDHSKSLTPKTITTLNAYKKSVYNDPYHVVTLTNGMALAGDCLPGDVTLNVMPGRTLTIA